MLLFNIPTSANGFCDELSVPLWQLAIAVIPNYKALFNIRKLETLHIVCLLVCFMVHLIHGYSELLLAGLLAQ